MKSLFSIFLAIVMVIGVVVPSMVQLQGEDICEMKEKSGDDAADEDYKIGKEKDIYPFSVQLLSQFNAFSKNNSREKHCFQRDNTVSENHALLPEIPPEA